MTPGFAALWLMVAPVFAGDPPTLTIGPGGPDRQIDASSSFVVKGKTTASQVFLLALQRKRPAFGAEIDQGASCSSLSQDIDSRLDTGKLEKARGEASILSELVPDGSGVPSGSIWGHPLLVAGEWTRPEGKTGEQEFSVLVSDERRFFAAGGRYCLLVMERRAEKKVDDSVRSKVSDAIDEAQSCPDPLDCEAAKTKLEAALTALDDTAEGQKLRKLILLEMYRPALPHLQKVVRESAGALALAPDAEWAAAILAGQDVAIDAVRAPHGALIAELLVLNGKLQRAYPPGGGLQYVAVDTGRVVTSLRAVNVSGSNRIAGFVLTLVSDNDPKTSDVARVDADPSKMMVGGSELSLEDLLVFETRREIRVEGMAGYVDLRSVQDPASPLGGAFDEVWRGEGLGKAPVRVALFRQLERLDDLRTAAAASKDAANPSATDALVLLGRANDGAAGTTGVRKDLGTLAYAVDNFNDEATQWEAAHGKAVVEKERVWVKSASAVALGAASFDRKSFFDQFVTMKTGYAWLALPEGSEPMLRVGLDLTFYPNPVEDPMWSHGLSDWRRLFALELAIRGPEERGPFGYHDRYEGIGSLPPLFVGVSAQVLPYVSLGYGIACIEQRETGLESEVPKAVWTPYSGLSAQVNVPGIIRNATK